MTDRNYTIKDIAQMAGVSAGTVDRVLHDRGDVSPESKEKVQKVLDSVDYQPNVFAIGLAAKKRYTIACVTPFYEDDDYWHNVVLGIDRAAEELKPFNVFVEFLHYAHSDFESYMEACKKALDIEPDALLFAPNFREETRKLLRTAEEKNIPYVFIDYNIEEAKALKYIGQNSYYSGYISAKLLLQSYRPGDEVVLFLGNYRNADAEIQMTRRLEGFIRYVNDTYQEDIKISEVIITKTNEIANADALDTLFSVDRSNTLGVVFNSRVYQVGEYMRVRNHKMKGLVGYDLLRKNVSLLRSGEVTYLIGQRPMQQGYCGVKSLADKVIFKKQVDPLKYMPIDVLMKENIDYYYEFE
jgi:LacI family transcriptional regulator